MAPSTAEAQALGDTTITLGDRPTFIWFRSAPPSAAEDPRDIRIRERDRAELERAQPRLFELGFDVHEAHSLGDSLVTALEAYSSTVTLRWRDREWRLPTKLSDGYYLWSPGGRAYVCWGLRSEAFMVDDAHWYLEMLRRGVERDLLRRCEGAPAAP
jgi:hypothetical protein